MGTVQDEVIDLEERLRVAELAPDPGFFEDKLSNDVVMIGGDGKSVTRQTIVAAHQPGKNPKFTDVQMTDLKVVDHGMAAVVTCKGTYKSAEGSKTLKFMRVWFKQDGKWQIIAGSIFNL